MSPAFTRRADADDAALVEIAQCRLADVGNVARDFFRTQLGVARLDLELLDVDGGVIVLLHHLLGDQDRVLKVVAAPRHEGHQHVTAERQLAHVGAGTVSNDLTLGNPHALLHDGPLVDTGVLVRALELGELIDVAAHLARKLHRMMLAFDAHDDALGVDRVHDAAAACQHHGSGIAGGNAFHSGTDQRRLRTKQRNRLALHVRAHESAVGVVVLQERHQRSGYRYQLLRADVDVVDFFAIDQHEVAGLAGVDQFRNDAALVVDLGVGLRDDVPVLFPRRQVERERLVVDQLLLAVFQVGVGLQDLGLLQVIADAVIAIAGVHHADEVEHAAILHLAVRRLDEAVVVDPRIAAQRRDQSDVRTFRRLDRADTAIVRRVNVADFESRALTRQTARPKCRQTALVRDLRQRVGLVHELRQLRRSEELADGSHDRLGVDQVVRHGRRHLLVHAHLFLDGALHANQADAELVLQQLADRAHAAVAKVIDVVHRADVLAQLEQVTDGSVEVFRLQRAVLEIGPVFLVEQLDVELQAAHAREVVLPRIEEHAVEERGRGVERRRIARTQLAVNLDQRFLRRLHRIAAQRGTDDRAHIVALGEEHVHFADVRFHHLRQLVGRELGVGFEQHFAGIGVDDVGGNECAFQIAEVDFDLGDLVLLDLLHHRRRYLAAGVRDLFAALGGDAMRQLHAQQVRRLSTPGSSVQ